MKQVKKKLSLKRHGFATTSQMLTVVGLSSLFWLVVILIGNLFYFFYLLNRLSANWFSLQRSRGVTTFLSSTCHRNYKECVKISTMDYCGHLMKQCHETEEFILPAPVVKIEAQKAASLVFSTEENEVNLLRCQKKKFYDQKICRHLCSKTLVLESTRTNPISPCESMCFELTRSSDSAGEVCPTQKYCPYGCPCPFYDCEKIQSRQKMVPVFDLRKNSTHSDLSELHKDSQMITGRWSHRQNLPKQEFPKITFSDLKGSSKEINNLDLLFPYERFCRKVS